MNSDLTQRQTDTEFEKNVIKNVRLVINIRDAIICINHLKKGSRVVFSP